jgi:hypothetical protein
VSDFLCECDPGWEGKECEVEQKHVGSFSSNGTSGAYVQFTDKAAEWSKLRFEFRTTVQDGVLVYASADAVTQSNFFALEISKGTLIVHAGGKTVSLITNLAAEVANGEWHSVKLGSSAAGDVSVVLDDNYQTKLGQASTLGSTDEFFLGGPWPWSAPLHNQLISDINFVGCMRKVYVGGDGLLNMQEPLKATSSGVSYTCDHEEYCSDAPCGDAGSCQDLWDTFYCSCDYGIAGRHCNMTAPSVTFADGKSLQYQFRPKQTFLEPDNGFDDLLRASFRFRTRTLAAATLLFVAGQPAGSTKDHHLIVAITSDGRLSVTLSLGGSQVHSHNSSRIVTDGAYHTVAISRRAESTSVTTTLDGAEDITATAAGATVHLGVSDSDIFLGGVGDPTVKNTQLGSLQTPFNGCMQDFRLHGKQLPFDVIGTVNAIARPSELAAGCDDGDVCSVAKNPCPLNSSTCINNWREPFCDCHPGYGDGLTPNDCTFNIDECEADPCENGAACIDGINKFTCDCEGTGFEGTTCESNVDDCAADPCNHFGVCKDKILDFSCECLRQYEGKTCNDNVNECAGNPCGPIGYCEELPVEFGCGDMLLNSSKCQTGWVGRTCHDYTKCNNDEQFESSPAGEKRDRICSPLTQCGEEQYASIVKTNFSDRTCSNLTVCSDPGETEFEEVAETATDDRICTIIRPPCEIELEEYESMAPTPTNNRVCDACSTCVFGDYIKTPCGQFNDNDCQVCDKCENGGECFASVIEDFYCECPVGFVGKNCSLIEPCVKYGLDYFRQNGAHENACLNGGVCVGDVTTFDCECGLGFAGDRCELPTCDPEDPCISTHEHAIGCTDDEILGHVCICAGGWMGEDCATRELACSPNPCGHGECDSPDDGGPVVCSCHAGYKGADCGEKITSTSTTGTTTTISMTRTTTTTTTATSTTRTTSTISTTTTTTTTSTTTTLSTTTLTSTTITSTTITSQTPPSTTTITTTTRTTTTRTTATKTATSTTTVVKTAEQETDVADSSAIIEEEQWPSWMYWVWVGLALLVIAVLVGCFYLCNHCRSKPAATAYPYPVTPGRPIQIQSPTLYGGSHQGTPGRLHRPPSPAHYDNANDDGIRMTAVENTNFELNHRDLQRPVLHLDHHSSPQQSPAAHTAVDVQSSNDSQMATAITAMAFGAPPGRSPPAPPTPVGRPPAHPLEESSFM